MAKKKRLQSKSLKKQFIIELEGLDESGKTTLIEALIKELPASFPTEVIVEPSDNIRKMTEELWEADKTSIDKRYRISNEILFLADRIKHSNELSENKIYIFDRYLLSTFAYQVRDSISEDIALEVLKVIKKPNLVVYIDVPPEISSNKSGISLNKTKEIKNNYWLWLKRLNLNVMTLAYDVPLDKKVSLIVDKILEFYNK